MPDREARGGTLIVGGGFAGSYVARKLGRRGATIISPENFMLFTPMLPEAASGTLEPRHATLGRYKGIANVFGFPIKGFLGWWVTRTYHLYQLPLLSRKLRVVTDWTVALFFRRDIAELGVLEHPRRLGD